MALCMVLKRMKAIFIKDLIYLQANDRINTRHHELINLLYGQDLMFVNASRKSKIIFAILQRMEYFYL